MQGTSKSKHKTSRVTVTSGLNQVCCGFKLAVLIREEFRPRLHGTGFAYSRHQVWSVCAHIYFTYTTFSLISCC